MDPEESRQKTWKRGKSKKNSHQEIKVIVNQKTRQGTSASGTKEKTAYRSRTGKHRGGKKKHKGREPAPNNTVCSRETMLQ